MSMTPKLLKKSSRMNEIRNKLFNTRRDTNQNRYYTQEEQANLYLCDNSCILLENNINAEKLTNI